ncbi:mCG1042477, partial [Mus musculus]
QKLMGKFALEGLSGQALCVGGGGVECLHDILYHKILIRMFLTCFFPPCMQIKVRILL